MLIVKTAYCSFYFVVDDDFQDQLTQWLRLRLLSARVPECGSAGHWSWTLSKLDRGKILFQGWWEATSSRGLVSVCWNEFIRVVKRE